MLSVVVIWIASICLTAHAASAQQPKPASANVTSQPTTLPAAAPLPPERLFAQASPAVVRVELRDSRFRLIGEGSGFLVSEDGLVVTNHHVIDDAYFAFVLRHNGVRYLVDGVAAVDRNADLALLKVEVEDVPFLELAGPQLPKVGTKVYAIGNPKGLTNTFTEGLVSGHRNINDGVRLIQTSCAISRGSSGGALLRGDGKVVGVTTCYLEGGQNLNFAVPAARVVNLLKNRGPLRTLAGAGGRALKRADFQRLDHVWAAIGDDDYALALSRLASLRDSEKDSPFYWYTLGCVHGRSENYGLAIDAFRTASKLAPADATVYHMLGLAHASLDQHEEAISALKTAIEIEPTGMHSYALLGWVYEQSRQYEQAVVTYISAIIAKPDNARMYTLLGQAYVRSALLRYTYDPFDLAGRAVHISRLRQAIAALQTAIAINPNDAEAHSHLGTAYMYLSTPIDHESLELSKKAIAEYRSAIQLGRNEYSILGRLCSELRQHDDAIDAYERALAIKPDNDSVRRNLARARERRQHDLSFQAPPEWTQLGGDFGDILGTLAEYQIGFPDVTVSFHSCALQKVFQDKNATENIAKWAQGFGIDPETVEVEAFGSGDLRISCYELAGSLAGEPPRSDWRLLGAFVEGPGGPWFFCALGPDATIARHREGFRRMVHSIRR